MRKGISMTLTILVVALVLLATTIALMTLGTNVTQRISQIVGQGQGDEAELARQHCERRRDVICAQADLEEWEETNRLDQWAEQANYEGRTCKKWQEDEQIYGSSGIPECSVNN